MAIGDLSTLLVWGAATCFTIALLGYTTSLAKIADAAAVVAREAAEERRRARAARTTSTVTSSAAVRESVTAGSASRGGSTLTVEPPADGPSPVSPVTGTPVVDGVVTQGPSADLGRASDGAGADGRAVRAEGIARTTGWLGSALLLAGVVFRGIAAGRWPTANMYEFILVGVLVATLVLAAVQRRRVVAFLGVVVMGISVLSLAAGLLVFFVQADAVQPALQSYWLVIHVGVAITATGVFTVGFGASVLQVLVDGRENGRTRLETPWRSADGVHRMLEPWKVTGPRWAWLEQVPGSARLEALSFRLNAIGFVLWAFTLIGGAIWAEHAWGRYWGWDPKEVGTFVAWVVYAAYLHARTTRGWAGRRAAYFVWVGYAAVIANFTVINLVVTGKHSYSGLG